MRRPFGKQGRRSHSDRRIETRNPLPRILIVCEGEKTEVNYFRAFRAAAEVIGTGMETLRVVEVAQRKDREEGRFDQIRCVFDRDSFPPDDFDNAIHKIESLEKDGFRAAYSNVAFELWFVLHFEYLDAALTCEDYIEKLNGYLGCKYRKNDANLYDLLQDKGNEATAVAHARRLRDCHHPRTPISQCNPATAVDLLVEALREFQKQKENPS